MFGTSTTSGNFSDEGKTCLSFTSALFTLFFLAKLVAKVQGTRENLYFPRLTLLLPLSYIKLLRQLFIQKC